MKREFLKGLELADEVVEQIMAEYGKSIEKSKADLAAKDTQISSLKAQITEANETIKGFEGLDVDGIKQAAADWEAKAKAAEKDAQEQLAALKFDYQLENALRDAKAKNVKAAKALLDMDKILSGDDGKIIGLDEQLKAIQAENGYLFDSEQPDKAGSGTPYKPQGGQGVPDYSQMSDEEYYSMKYRKDD